MRRKLTLAALFCLAGLSAYALVTPENIDKARMFIFGKVKLTPTDTVPTASEGVAYWDNSENALKVYNGSGWVALLNSSTTFGESALFEGTTADDYETTVTAIDPTADNAISIPNASGTFMLSALATNAPDIANSVWGISAGLKFEGSSADGNELTVTAVNPGAARTITFPDATGTVLLSTAASGAADSVTGAANGFIFEGASSDAYELTVVSPDVTADATVTYPSTTGTLCLTTKNVVVYNAAATPRAVTAAESGTVFVLQTSDGAGAVTFNLPTAAAGLTYTFCDMDAVAAKDLKIKAATGDKINSGTAAEFYNNTEDAVKCSVTITAIDATDWVVTSEVGAAWANAGS